MSSRRFWLVMALLFVLDCTKHAATFSTGPAPLALDARQYWELAEAAADGDWLHLRNTVSYRTPLYPAFLAVFRLLFDSRALLAAAVCQHLLVIGTGLLAALICRQIAGRREAALAGYALSVACLTRPWFANVMLSETLFTFSLTATLSALVAYHQRPSIPRAIAWTALLGVTILVRPVPQLLWVPLFVLCLFHATRWSIRRQSLREVALQILAGAAALALVLSPWYVRNRVVFGEAFLTRLPAVNKWQVCFQGGAGAHLPIPEGAAGRRLLHLIGTPGGDVPDRYCYAVVAALKERGLTEHEVDELISDVCIAAIREHPVAFTWATFKRFVNFWRCTVGGYPFFGSGLPDRFADQRSWRLEGVAEISERVLRHTPAGSLRWNEFVIAVCAIGTLVLIGRRHTRVVGLSLAAVFVYFAAVSAAVEMENYRYRMVLEPALIVAAVSGLFGLRPASAVSSGDPRQTPTTPTAAARRG
jgi:Dolichyl-phosphate-mannose-protein mannosyltransferase